MPLKKIILGLYLLNRKIKGFSRINGAMINATLGHSDAEDY